MKNIKNKIIKNSHFSSFISNFSRGFTFIEAILYVAIVSVMLSALIPFAWDIIEGGARSSVQQEVSSNARFISERIKYEIRNATGINGTTDCASASKIISLVNNNAGLNPTIITYTSPNITIKQGAGATVNLNSADVLISGFTCSNNTSGVLTKNISFAFTVNQAYTGARADFKSTITVQSSAELRSN
jgi:Tfp pilus assembly protein PilE